MFLDMKIGLCTYKKVTILVRFESSSFNQHFIFSNHSIPEVLFSKFSFNVLMGRLSFRAVRICCNFSLDGLHIYVCIPFKLLS